MNNKCPTCGSPYNINASHVGRTFSCQRCQSQLVVQADGLQLAGVQQPQTAAQPTVPQTGAGAYGDYGAAGGVTTTPVAKGPNWMVDFLLFRRMIAPLIVMVSFWICMVASALAGLFVIVMGLIGAGQGGILSILIGLVAGLACFTIVPLWIRVVHEFFMVTFRINETLTDILNELKRS